MKNRLRHLCVKQGDKGYPVRVGNAPKVCRFDSSVSESIVTCDYETFMNKNLTSESAQYVLVHHEYAGISGVEDPMGEVSTYAVSNQITDFLEDVIVKKLAVKAPKNIAPPADPQCSIDTMKNEIAEGIKSYIKKTFAKYSPITVDMESIQITYQGMLDFEDYDFAGGIKKEHAFEVVFKSDKGTEFLIVSTTSNWPLLPKQPMNYVFSIPEMVVEKTFDLEGNVTGAQCVASTHRGFNRDAYFLNATSGKVVEDDLISSSMSVLAVKDIR